ncbi:MAG: hypothetical protein M0R22_00100 [Dehalococcoidia bacterium]|jgi:hypothetical protein|nr:hypothetical protein [Dehalococcoidia bacterium]
MRWRNGKPTCASCTFFDTSEPTQLTQTLAQRFYTPAEETGGVCQRAATPFRSPRNAVCACYEGPALPWWTKISSSFELRVRRALAQEALDSLSSIRDDAAVLRCALSGAWRRAVDARARSHELWAVLTPALNGDLLPDAPVWRDRFTNVTISISRWLQGMGDMAALHAIQEAGVESLGIIMPERDTGRLCERCGESLNSIEHVDPVTKETICRGCALKIGLVEKSS